MKSLLLVLPDQLSEKNKVLDYLDGNNLLLAYEPYDSFYEIAHHKHKLVFQISSFRHFIKKISYKNIIHVKISSKPLSLQDFLLDLHSKENFSSLYITKPSDYKTLKDLMYFSDDNHVLLSQFFNGAIQIFKSS